MKVNVATLAVLAAAVATEAAGASVRGAAAEARAKAHVLQSAPCKLGHLCEPREVAQVVLAQAHALPTGSRTSYCEAAVAVAFGESGKHDITTNDCPLATPACIDSEAKNQNNPDVRGAWQMGDGNGVGSLTQQAQMLWTKYVGNQPGLTWDQVYCFNTGSWADKTPIPELPKGTGNAAAQQWLFCNGAFTGASHGSSNYYSKFMPAAKKACAAL